MVSPYMPVQRVSDYIFTLRLPRSGHCTSLRESGRGRGRDSTSAWRAPVSLDHHQGRELQQLLRPPRPLRRGHPCEIHGRSAPAECLVCRSDATSRSHSYERRQSRISWPRFRISPLQLLRSTGLLSYAAAVDGDGGTIQPRESPLDWRVELLHCVLRLPCKDYARSAHGQPDYAARRDGRF